MRLIFYIAFSCFYFFSLAQPSDPYAFHVKRNFDLGESHTYEVKELFKIDNQFLVLKLRSELSSTVSFEVVDTANGGCWLRYAVSVNSVKQRRDSSAYITAMLIDGINLIVYAKDGNFSVDSSSYFETKHRVTGALDSIAAGQLFGKDVSQYINYLKSQLKEDAGLGTFLGPLMLFEVYYSSGVYKKFRINEDGITANVLGQPSFSGLIEKQWVGTTNDGIVKLNCFFTGLPVPAAKYFRSVYENYFAINSIKVGKHFFPPEIRYIINYDFHTKTGVSFPSYLFKKNVSEHRLRLVSKIEMKEVIDDQED